MNVAIESYNANLKTILKSCQQKFDGRCIYWLIYHLLKDVHIHYKYVVQYKLYGFINNGKIEGIVVNVVIRALEFFYKHVSILEEANVTYLASEHYFPTCLNT